MTLGRLDSPPHDDWVGGMKTTSNIRMRDVRHAGLIIAQIVDAEAFAHVTVNRHRHGSLQDGRKMTAAIRGPRRMLQYYNDTRGQRLFVISYIICEGGRPAQWLGN